jgi:hypothetical protein
MSATPAPRRDWKPVIRAAVLGALLAALAVLAVEFLFTVVERGTGFFSRLPESLKVMTRRGLLDQRVAGGDAYDPRTLPWLAGMIALFAAGRSVAKGEERLGSRLLLGASVAVPYGLIWLLAALLSFRTILEEEPLTLLWPFAWGALFGALGGFTAANARSRIERRVRIGLAGARSGLVMLVAAAVIGLLVHAALNGGETMRFFKGRDGYTGGVLLFASRLPTAVVNVERVGTLETVEHLAPLADPGRGVGLTAWPGRGRETYGFLEPRVSGGGADTAPLIWWLLLLVPLAGGLSAGRTVGRLNGRAAEGAIAGLIMALGVALVVFAGSPAPGAFGPTHEGTAISAPLLFGLLWFVPVGALAAEVTFRRRPAAVYAPTGAVARPIAPEPTVRTSPPEPPPAPPVEP